MKKQLETLCILLVFLAFVIMGYYTYKSYADKKKETDDIEINNYYDEEYLFNSDYIKLPNTISDFSSMDSDIYMHVDDKTLIIESKDENQTYKKTIKGIPDGEYVIYYNSFDDYYEFLIKSNSDIYYSYVNITDGQEELFNHIEGDINQVYVPSYDKSGVFINKNKHLITNFIILDKNKQLSYIDYNEGYYLKPELQTRKPYFDYICAVDNYSICKNLVLYITFKEELVYNGEILKNDKNKSVYVKDVFSSFEVNGDSAVDYENLSMKEAKKKGYLFTSYIFDKKGLMYKYEITNDGESLKLINDSSNKVKMYSFEKDDDSSLLSVLFENGKKDEYKIDNNKIMTTSTVYDKNNNKEKIIMP